MILKLEEKHRQIVLDYVAKEASINLFIIGDIEQHGFDKDFQEIWGKFDKNNNLKGVLLRYENNFIPYMENINEDICEFKRIIRRYEGNKIISGKNDIVDKFKDVLDEHKEKETYFCELEDKKNLLPWDESIKRSKEEDAIRIYDLFNTIEEFSVNYTVERIRDRIRDNSTISYYIDNDEDEIITISQITAENSQSAMVVGVATKIEYREQGYMSKCLSKLCNDFLDKGKKLCLFYDNPKAGKVYHKLGFKEIGIWTMLVEEN